MTLNSARKTPLHGQAATIFELAGALFLAACSSTPAPTPAVTAVQANAVAGRKQVADAASPELARIQGVDATNARAQVVTPGSSEQSPEVDSAADAYTEAQRKAQELKTQIEESTGRSHGPWCGHHPR